ncbi:MAG: DNA translocase FtsK 4TM domain-containing protein, partial [Pseudomonadota bacterium]
MARARALDTVAMADDRAQSVSDPVLRMLTGALSFAVGVFVCGSVGSYAPADPSWNAATSSEAQNLFGAAGAVFADLSRQSFGWSAWTAGLAAMIGGAMRTVLIGQPKLSRWLLGLLFVPLSAACFAAWPVPASWPLSAGLGGVIGDGLLYALTVPFDALMLPAAQLLAGIVSGVAAALCATTALGFGRRDAHLLHRAAARESLRAARSARLFGGLLSTLMAKREKTANSAQERRIVVGPQLDDTAEALEADDGYYDEDEAEIATENLPESASKRVVPTPGAVRRAVAKPKPMRVHKGGVRSGAQLPPIDLLQDPPVRSNAVDEDALLSQAARLTEVLMEFGVRGRIIEVRPGPVVTLFEFEPAAGVKSARVIALADDIARSMSATSARIAVVPGKNAMGIELPNETRETVYLKTLLSSDSYRNAKASLPMALGEDIGGAPTVVELAKMPHLLIAGTTGSGKSVGVNAMILSLMYRLSPEQCRFIMIDPKMLELSIYEGVPHLLSPVVTDPKLAVNALKWTVREMESRYELMSKANVRNLAGFNAKAEQYRREGKELTRKVQTGFDEDGKAIYETEVLPIDSLPKIVVVIDEMADLMMVAGKEI